MTYREAWFKCLQKKNKEVVILYIFANTSCNLFLSEDGGEIWCTCSQLLLFSKIALILLKIIIPERREKQERKLYILYFYIKHYSLLYFLFLHKKLNKTDINWSHTVTQKFILINYYRHRAKEASITRFFYFLYYLSRTRCGGRPTFLTEREYEGRRDRREIKLETSNISPLGAVAILRAISIRDVVIENERALSLCLSRALDVGKREREKENFNFFFHFFPSFNNSSRRSRARARAHWKLKRWLSNFLFRAVCRLFLLYRMKGGKGKRDRADWYNKLCLWDMRKFFDDHESIR